MKVTSTEIARQLGISRSTVSRALSGYPHVEESLRQKILEKAEELNYRPNQAARSLAKGDELLLGVVLFAEKHDRGGVLESYMEDIQRGVRFAAAQLRDYGLTVETVVTDIKRPQEQVDALEDLMARGAKGIVLAPCDPEVVAPTVDKMSAQNVQTLLLNVDVPQSSRLCYVGSDYVQAGRLAAELLGQMMKGSGRVAPIIFQDRGNMIPQKLTGFREEIGRYPEIEILGPYSFSRTGEGVYEDTLKLIQSEGPDALFMSYGQMENVARAIEDAGMAERIALVGFDTSEEVLSYLDKRVISAVIAQEPAQQGMLCVRLLYDFLARGIRPRSSLVHAKLEIITHQNCRYYRRDSLNVCTYAYRGGSGV